MVTAVLKPAFVSYATVRVVPHSVALGQQRAITVKVQIPSNGVVIGVLHVGHPNLSSEGLRVPGSSGSALFNGCSWCTYGDGSGHFFYGGKYRAASVDFVSGDEVSAVVDRRTHSGNGSNGVVRFIRNEKTLEKAEPLPIGFTEEAVLVMSFRFIGGIVKIVSFE